MEVIHCRIEASLSIGLSSFHCESPSDSIFSFDLRPREEWFFSKFWDCTSASRNEEMKTEWRKYYSLSQGCVLTPGEQLFGSCCLATVTSRKFSPQKFSLLYREGSKRTWISNGLFKSLLFTPFVISFRYWGYITISFYFRNFEVEQDCSLAFPVFHQNSASLILLSQIP